MLKDFILTLIGDRKGMKGISFEGAMNAMKSWLSFDSDVWMGHYGHSLCSTTSDEDENQM